MIFKDIFPDEKIMKEIKISPLRDDQSSDIWKVKTNKREVIVRSPRRENVENNGIFLNSVKILFGIDLNNAFSMEHINNALAQFDAFIYPKIISKHKTVREYIVAEFIQGTALDSFTELSDEELKKFGVNLAKIHRHKMDYLGNAAGTFKMSLDMVNNHIEESIKRIINEFYFADKKIVNYLPDIISALNALPVPEYTSYVLVDMDPDQFLTQDNIITGLVDTQCYAVAPRELDFIALEYVLDKHSADMISEGYKAILQLPDLKKVRKVYRYLYRLVEIQGQEDIDEWLSQPILFD